MTNLIEVAIEILIHNPIETVIMTILSGVTWQRGHAICNQDLVADIHMLHLKAALDLLARIFTYIYMFCLIYPYITVGIIYSSHTLQP